MDEREVLVHTTNVEIVEAIHRAKLDDQYRPDVSVQY